MTEISLPAPPRTSNSQPCAASEDDRPPPYFDPAKVKLGPGALPANACDPLKWEETDLFWNTVDLYFLPIDQGHLDFLKGLPSNCWGGARDPGLRIPELGAALENGHGLTNLRRSAMRKRTQARSLGDSNGRDTEDGSENGDHGADELCNGNGNVNGINGMLRPRLNSYPYTQRLYAAMIDVGGGGSFDFNVATPKIKGLDVDDTFWMGPGEDAPFRLFQRTLEERVKHELRATGLIDTEDDDPTQTELRQSQWELRDAKTATFIRRGSLQRKVVQSEVRKQALRREQKRYSDNVEMYYLMRMMKRLKKNKKSRSKYQRLYNAVSSRYKEETQKSGKRDERHMDAVVKNKSKSAKSASKKKRRKLESTTVSDSPSKATVAETKGSNITRELAFGESRHNAEQLGLITSIISQAGGEATIEHIASEYVKHEQTINSVEAARKKVSWTLSIAVKKGGPFRRVGSHRYALT